MSRYPNLPKIEIGCCCYPPPRNPLLYHSRGRLKTELSRGEVRYEVGTEVVIYGVEHVGSSPMFYHVVFPDGYRCRLFIDLDLVEIEDERP